VAFRRTAACLWGLDGIARGAIELAVTSGRPASARLHRVRSLAPGDREYFDEFPLTSVSRTLLDLEQVLGADAIERAVESALRKGYVSVDSLRSTVGAAPNLRGTRALRELIACRATGLAPTESDAETLFLHLARRTGLPEPHRQYVVATSEGVFRLDFAWPTRHLAVEIDGAATHASREALARDLRRQNRLILSLASVGWNLLRFTWDHVALAGYADQVAAKLREAWAISLARPVKR
jgi:very-short-patch-repair endonuclease